MFCNIVVCLLIALATAKRENSLLFPLRNHLAKGSDIRIEIFVDTPTGQRQLWANMTTQYGVWHTDQPQIENAVPMRGAVGRQVFLDVHVYRVAPPLLLLHRRKVPLLTLRKPMVKRTRYLLEEAAEAAVAVDEAALVWHCKSRLRVSLLDDFEEYASSEALGEMMTAFYEQQRAVRRRGALPASQFVPILFVNDFYNVGEDFVRVDTADAARGNVTVRVEYVPQTLVRWKWMHELDQVFTQGNSPLVSSEAEGEEMKRMFLDTHPYLLYATSLVSLLHLVFDFLAFKNDIAFWKQRKSFEGLSIRSLFASALSQLVILLYLANEKTSKLVLVPAAIGCVVEAWKLTRAFTFTLSRAGLHVAERYARSAGSAELDRVAWQRLGPLLALGIVVYAIYSLVYVKQTGWYSWLVRTLAGAVYGAGFITMTPQLFINYKLKSVAHLPWRVFGYKAMNTFIDDLFAFVIRMPTMHRAACFRDDLVFVVYLYQRYIYPIDKSRVNEYGQKFQEEEENKEEENKEESKETENKKTL